MIRAAMRLARDDDGDAVGAAGVLTQVRYPLGEGYARLRAAGLVAPERPADALGHLDAAAAVFTDLDGCTIGCDQGGRPEGD